MVTINPLKVNRASDTRSGSHKKTHDPSVDARLREIELIRKGKPDPRLKHAEFDENGRLVWYRRWNSQHRIQHFMLMTSFGGLVLTGFPLKFAESPASKVLMLFMGGVKGAGILHRLCAVLLIFMSAYHVTFLIASYMKGERSGAMLPRARDFKDVWDNFAYFLGFKRPPKFARYNYLEKFEYFAVVWGNVVMILTGLVLWFPVFAQNNMPEWAFPGSLLLHDYEALLAALAIILWHLFNVHIHPSSYPLNPVWLTGKLNREMMAHHHGEELAELEAAWRVARAMDAERDIKQTVLKRDLSESDAPEHQADDTSDAVKSAESELGTHSDIADTTEDANG